MENKYFKDVKRNFGFGCMRLPMKDNEIDFEEMKKMVDLFIEKGFNYFDTARGYHGGKSETALKECLTSRYPRNAYILTNKLSTHFFETEEEIRPYFESQLEACGVDYFDFYLMHAQDGAIFKKYKKCHAYENALKFKEEGKIKHFGISFHDGPEVLERILTEYPQIEVVQIQLNYVDCKSVSVQSQKVYEVCEKFNKPVIVMEPVKGGRLVNLPEDAKKVFDELQKDDDTKMSYASYAIRFAASFKNVHMVLSGMSDLEQMKDNISYMEDFKALNEDEYKAIDKVCEIFGSLNMIPCTSCHYCVLDNECPMNIQIPELFNCYNQKTIFKSWNEDYYYNFILTRDHGKASECLKCGMCENICPQHLPIRDLLEDVAKEFEHKE
ncbi:MAG: aldo/keto reductase [Erysipelotrichaceae bacterium]|nr:aldo/keto reductase [Erysipelotrichaceae bacterium]